MVLYDIARHEVSSEQSFLQAARLASDDCPKPTPGMSELSGPSQPSESALGESQEVALTKTAALMHMELLSISTVPSSAAPKYIVFEVELPSEFTTVNVLQVVSLWQLLHSVGLEYLTPLMITIPGSAAQLVQQYKAVHWCSL